MQTRHSELGKLRQWRGLAALATDLVVHGASAVEEVHLATAGRPFDVLERMPAVAGPARVVRVVHETWTRGVYATIRAVASLTGRLVDVALARDDRAA